MHFRFNVSFPVKLAGAIIGLVTVAIVLSTAVTFRQAVHNAQELGEESLESTTDILARALLPLHSMLAQDLRNHMTFLRDKMVELGMGHVDNEEQRSVTITDETGAQRTTKVPLFKLKDYLLTEDTALVDEVRRVTGSHLSLLQVVDGALVRVATTIPKDDGSRAIWTALSGASPVTQAILQGKEYVGMATVLGQPYMTFYQPIKDRRNGVIGARFVGRPLLTPEIVNLIKGTRLGEEGYAFLFDSTGILHIHPTIQGKNVYQIPVVGELFRQQPEGLIRYTFQEKTRLAFLRPLPELGVTVGLTIPAEQLTDSLRPALVQGIWVALGQLVGTILISWLLIRALQRPIQAMGNAAACLARGDFRVKVHYAARDILGELAQAMNTMIQAITPVLRNLGQATTSLDTGARRLERVADATVSQAQQEMGQTEAMAERAGVIHEAIDAVRNAIERAGSNLASIAAAAHQMSTTMHGIAGQAASAKTTVTDARATTQESSATLARLDEAAQEIGAVTRTIADISAQTNLLALNATIEAARAGEAGRGFAVVANEIKELANQTARATEQIHTTIGSIQHAVAEAIAGMERITHVMDAVVTTVTNITTAVDEEALTVGGISSNVGDADADMRQIISRVEEVAAMASSLSQDAQALRAAAGRLLEQGQSVRQEAVTIRTTAEDLGQLTGYFQIEGTASCEPSR